VRSYFADTAFWIALFSIRDQYHLNSLSWQKHLTESASRLITTEAVCWEWMNAMAGISTRKIVGKAYERICQDPHIEVISASPQMSDSAVRLFTSRADKEWSVTDCLSFVIMQRRNIVHALTADRHFEQAGFQAVLTKPFLR